MATFYFNGAIDSEWTTLGNWWMTFDGTNYSNQATVLPSSSDDVIVNGTVESSSESSIIILSLTINSPGYIQIVAENNITISTINGTTINESASITGSNTIINGNITLYNTASIGVTVNGNVTFNDTSYALGSYLQINGNATFNDYSYFDSGITSSTLQGLDITGTVTFNDYSYHAQLGGLWLKTNNAIFNDNSYQENDSGIHAINSIIFNDHSSIIVYGYAYCPDGEVIFNDYSHIRDDGSIINSSSVTFNHNSYINDSALLTNIDNIVFNDNSMNKVGLGNNFILNRTTSPNGSSLLGIL